MLELVVKHNGETFDLQFEHSLRSLSKWESKYRKPFISKFQHEAIEMLYYFECMLMSPGVDSNLVYALAPEQLDQLAGYINDAPTASKVPTLPKSGPSEIMTSELIYYWMVAMKINWEAQDWHLSRLLMLIQITNHKSQPEKNRKQAINAQDWQDANERQKALFKTKG